MEKIRRREPYPGIEIVTRIEIEGEGTSREMTGFERWIETDDGKQVYSDNRKSRQALAGLLHVFDDLDLSDTEEGFVPIEVAVKSNPAITAYLLGVNNMSVEEVSDSMGVKKSTVRKHVSRFRRHAKETL